MIKNEYDLLKKVSICKRVSTSKIVLSTIAICNEKAGLFQWETAISFIFHKFWDTKCHLLQIKVLMSIAKQGSLKI